MALPAYPLPQPAAKAARAEDRRAGQNAGSPASWMRSIEARMQQARREIRMHIQLLPYSLDERGNRLVKTGSGDMPFGF